MNKYIIALDVGGTTISAAAINITYEFLTEIYTYPAESEKDADSIVKHFGMIIDDIFQASSQSDRECIGVSIGFPGPFDYENGRSLMKNIGKYEKMYQYPFKEKLKDTLKSLGVCDEELPIVFYNDALLFGLGEYVLLEGKEYERIMGITIGTGCGAAFIVKGELICGRNGIPDDGAIYHLPFKQSIIDDYISKRGILNLSKQLGYFHEKLDVIDLFHNAENKDTRAIQVFVSFGENLLEALRSIIVSFDPEIIVIGGQIANAYKFYGGLFNEFTKEKGIEVKLVEVTPISTLVGATYFFIKKGLS